MELAIWINDNVEQKEGLTNLAHGVVVGDEGIDSFNCQEALIHGSGFSVGVKDVRRNDSRKVVDIHLASGFFVYMRER